MAVDTDPNQDAEIKSAAKLLKEIESVLDADGGFAKFADRVAAIEGLIEPLKGLDASKIEEEFEKSRASMEAVVNRIKHHRGDTYISGIEDEEFSMMKTIRGLHTGSWKGAEKEKEILDQVRQKKAQVVGDDSLGGYFVPDNVIPEVIGAIYGRSAFIALADGVTRVSVLEGLTGANVKIPKFNGGTSAYWVGEEDPYTESNVDVGDVSMNPKKLGALVKLTEEMLKLGAYGFESLLRRDMVESFAAKLDYTFLFGTGGDNMPLGLIRQPGVRFFHHLNDVGANQYYADLDASLAAVTDVDGAGANFDTLEYMRLNLEEDDIIEDPSFTTISSPRFFSELKRSKVDHYMSQADNQSYLLGAPGLPDSRLTEAMGSFGKMNQIPSNAVEGQGIWTDAVGTAGHSWVVMGNMREALLGRWAGIEFISDGGMGTGFATDHTFQKMRMLCDIGVRQSRAFILSPDALVRP